MIVCVELSPRVSGIQSLTPTCHPRVCFAKFSDILVTLNIIIISPRLNQNYRLSVQVGEKYIYRCDMLCN